MVFILTPIRGQRALVEFCPDVATPETHDPPEITRTDRRCRRVETDSAVGPHSWMNAWGSERLRCNNAKALGLREVKQGALLSRLHHDRPPFDCAIVVDVDSCDVNTSTE